MRAITCISLAAGFVAASGMAPGEQFARPLGMPLVETTVEAVQHHLGAARVVRSGHYEDRVCYVDAASGLWVEFMHQAEGLSGGFSAKRATAARRCSPLPPGVVPELARSVGGLQLGMQRSEFVATVGGKVKVSGDVVTATFEHADRLEAKPGKTATGDAFFTSVIVRGRFEADALVEYSVLKTCGS